MRNTNKLPIGNYFCFTHFPSESYSAFAQGRSPGFASFRGARLPKKIQWHIVRGNWQYSNGGCTGFAPVSLFTQPKVGHLSERTSHVQRDYIINIVYTHIRFCFGRPAT